MRSLFFSLRTRVLLLVGFGFCIFLAAIAHQAYEERTIRLEAAKDALLSTAKLIAVEEHNAIESTGELLASMISQEDLRRFVHEKDCHGHFGRTLMRVPRFANVLLALPDGRVICSATPLPGPLNIADRPHFATALKSPDTVISEAFEGRVTGKWVLPIYRSLRDEQGEILAVIAIGLELAWLNHQLASGRNLEGGRLGLIDAQGRVLARYPDPESWIGRNASATPFFRAVTARGGAGVAESEGFDGVPRVYGLARFATTPAGSITLWVGVATESITAEAERHFVITVAVALALLLLAFAIIWAGGERLLLRPISVLSRTAGRLGAGDLTARTGIGSVRDELGMLARSIDDMAESLELKNRQIHLAHRALKVLSAWNRVLLKPGDEAGLAEGMCRAIVEAGQYRMAWVGYAEDDADKTIRAIACAGTPEGYVENLRVTWADNEYGRGPAGQAIRRGTVVVVNDDQTNPDTAPWRENAVRYGLTSVIGLPLKVEDRIIGALVIHAAESEAFAEQEAVLLGEVATDLSSAIFAQRSRAERTRLEVSLRTSEERFRAAAEASLDALFILKGLRDAAGDIVDFELTDMNARAERQLGMTRDQAIGRTFLELIPRNRTAVSFDQYARVVTTRTPREGEFPLEVPQKGTRWFREQVVPVGEGIAVSLRDITAWKAAGDKLRENEERLRLAMDAARMGTWVWDMNADWHSLSDEMLALFGRHEGTGTLRSASLLDAVFQADRETLTRALATARATRAPGQLEYRVVWPDGSLHWLAARFSVICDPAGKPVQAMGVAMDITQRKQADIALARANRALRTLSAGNEELVRATSESDLLHAVCRVIVEKGGYRRATVGYPKDASVDTIVTMAAAGTESIALAAETGMGNAEAPVAKAVRTGTLAIGRATAEQPAAAPAGAPLIKSGYASNLALPLLDGTRVIGALSIYSEEKEAFDEAEIRLLEELSRDLAYGIMTLRTRSERDRIAYEHQHHEHILRRSLEDSIQAIASTVEMRDPYTSGHQKRVADLAVAIAIAMGLDVEKIHGIHLAGVVHDLGKITVPAEILAKPGKLTAIEFQLIKAHSQAGYDILKDIHFPWPIATVVREHHERVDGSGYPRGIKGSEMLLESRIMAVADVVEAMASHRPYRPSLGIEPALKEIERGRGTSYDAAVVDACLGLFREGGFVLQT